MTPDLRMDIGDTCAMTLDFWTDSDNPDSNETMLVYGTDSGHVVVLHFMNDVLFNNNGTKKDKCQQIFVDASAKICRGGGGGGGGGGAGSGGGVGSQTAGGISGSVMSNNNGIGATVGSTSVGLSTPGTNHTGISVISKRKTHNDWCVKVRYFPHLSSIVSCSPDPKDSLVVATISNKRKQLRLWNPYRLQHPLTALKGHTSPIIDITINELTGQIISLSVDKDIKLWDIRKHTCLQTLVDPFQHRPEDMLSRLHFSGENGGKLIAASTTMTTYQLKENEVGVKVPRSHDYPLRGALYNANFNLVVSGCDGGVVNVWDFISGQKAFRFADVHDKSEITAMAFDASRRRLITGGRDGSIKMWNFNNGQLLHEIVKDDDAEVTGLMVRF
ncbi:hypothetical protein HK102_012084 [Quaeritorhiza haematococci]|nr:hypothetical protein HK102_012084 [Quaeritorhiza haematococci]